MGVQNVLPPRLDYILKSHEEYKKAFSDCCDADYLGHSFSILDEFIAEEAVREEPHVRCTSLDFHVREDGSRPAFRATESTGQSGVESFLSALSNAPPAAVEGKGPEEASFLIVENLCPETMVKLGLALSIPPHFWSEYIENLSWFWKRNIISQWMTLPSVQREQSFTKTQWVLPRRFTWEKEGEEDDDVAASIWMDPGLFVMSDSRTSRLNRQADVLRMRGGRELRALVAFIRETMMVWIGRENRADGRLVGLILTDPPFQARGVRFVTRHTHVAQTKPAPAEGIEPSPMSPVSLPSGLYRGGETPPLLRSTGATLASTLARKLSTSPEFRSQVLRDPFTALHGSYQAAASEWLLVDEYVGRDLAAIEYQLERGTAKLHTLQVFLQELLLIKRRYTRYEEVVQNALHQCKEHGRLSWCSPGTTAADSKPTAPPHSPFLSPPAQDLQHVLSRLARTRTRIESDVAVLLALVSIREAEQALTDSQGITRLTRVAAVFLPFTTVATVMSIPKDYLGPGGDGFWIFWLVSVAVVVASLWLAGGMAARNVHSLRRLLGESREGRGGFRAGQGRMRKWGLV